MRRRMLQQMNAGAPVDFPISLKDHTLYQNNSLGTSHTITLPDYSAGDVIAILSRNGGAGNNGRIDGWSVTSYSENGETMIIWKVADGSEGDTVTIEGNGLNGRYVAIAMSFKIETGTPSIVGAWASGDNPPNLNTGNSGQKLFMACYSTRRSENSIDGTPAGYSGLIQHANPDTTNINRVRIGISFKESEEVSDNPAAFTTSGLVVDEHAGTTAIILS
jgi:hypothetical protein